jgi:DNA-binding helix-hairpin-helix protein with protein kinase domain
MKALIGTREVVLGEVIARGGEGEIRRISSEQALVAKIYSGPQSERKWEKLRVMVARSNQQLSGIAAWPTQLLNSLDGKPIGFVMPRVDSRRDVHEVYSPKSRIDWFPEADVRFIVHCATNIARAFATVHSHEVVIGDVNHGNILVGKDGIARFIDCDSFQVRSGTDWHTCDVGVGLFTPPELQSRSFRGLMRSTNHDAFGLAVLLFLLLYQGRHPFAGRYSGGGDMPIERAIAEFRFAYLSVPNSTGMERPPGSISLASYGPDIAGLFTRAFAAGGVKSRPTAEAWVASLIALEKQLRVCSKTSRHHFPRSVPSCPWCPLEQAGARFFGNVGLAANSTEGMNADALWQAIERIPDPGPGPKFASISVTPDVQWRTSDRNRVGAAIWLVAMGTILLFLENAISTVVGIGMMAAAAPTWPWGAGKDRLKRREALLKALAEYNTLLDGWRTNCSQDMFLAKRAEMKSIYLQLGQLKDERGREVARLESRLEEAQLRRFLDRFRIEDASIPNIGATRTAMLASYGIETAGDVDESQIMLIPGFGPSLTSDLVRWRDRRKRAFRFNPNERVDPRDIARIDREIIAKRTELEMGLRNGMLALQQLSISIKAMRAASLPRIEAARQAVEQVHT